jgi:hypothetical protein
MSSAAADENDFALYADAVFPEQIVILWIAAMCVHEFGRDIAGSRVAKIGAGDGRILRVRIDVIGIFAQ